MPTDDGGSPIHSFIVEAREKKKAIWAEISLIDASETKLKVSRLIENNTYYFRVLAKNNIGVSEPLYSDRPIEIVRPPGAPDSPFPLLVTDIQSDNCTLEWKAPTWTGGEDLKGYIIEFRIGDSRSGQWFNVETVDAITKSYRVKNLSEGEEYFFRISAFNNIGVSEPLVLNRAVVPKKKLTIPSPPIGPITTIEYEKESLTIQWQPSKDNGGSKIYRYIILCREVNTASWNRIGAVDSETFSYKVDNLTENRFYHFRIVAENHIGLSDHLQTNEPIKVRSPYTVPSSPMSPLVVSGITDSSVIVSWYPPLSDGGCPIIGYLVKRRDLKRPVWVNCGRTGFDTHYIRIKDLVENYQYAVQVFAENSEGLSAPLESVDPIVPRKILGPPSEPSSFECIDVNENQITVLWEAPTNDGGTPIRAYKLEINEKSRDQFWTTVSDFIEPLSTSYCIENLKEGQKYFVRISAINDNGISAPKVLDKPITLCRMVQPPSPPTGPLKIVSIEKDSFTIGWNPPENDGGSPINLYEIELRDANKANWKHVGTADSSCCQFQVNNLIENSEYYVRVKASNESRLTSAPLEISNFITVKEPYQLPESPKDLRLISKGKDHVVLEFIGSEDDGGSEIFCYIVEKRDVNRVTWVRSKKVNASLIKSAVYRCEIFDLKPGTSYCFRVSAENKIGRSIPCDLVTIVDIEKEKEPPSKPFDLTINTRTSASIILKWTTPLYNGNDELLEYLIEEWNSKTQEWNIRAQCEATLTSCAINNLAEDLIYKYRVKAVNSKGTSEPSLETFGYETLKQLSAPSNPVGPLKATVSDDQSTITLHWLKPRHDGGSPIKRYIIERFCNTNFKSSSSEWLIVGYALADETTFSITECLNGDYSLSFRVIAENDFGKSVPIELLQPLTLELKQKIPESPSHLRCIEKTATTVTLVWKCFSADSLSCAEKYRIEKKQADASVWIRTGHSKSEDFTVYDLDPDSSYQFRVVAINSAGESQPSETHEPISMNIKNDVPSKPLQVYAEETTHDSVTLSWLMPKYSGTKPIIGYKIFQLATNDRDNRNWEEISEYPSLRQQLMYTITGLYHRFVYKFRIYAFNEIGVGEPIETEKVHLKKPIGN